MVPCTRQTFLKQYICKLVLGIAIINKMYEVPAEAKAIPLGQKPKRGRPTKTEKSSCGTKVRIVYFYEFE